jgi:3-oxoacyl-[acyl-carrier protein] reductase
MTDRPELAGVVIRPAARGDYPAVQELFAAHLVGLGYEPDPALDADMVDVAGFYQGAGSAFLVATDPGGGLVGMGGVRGGEIRRVHVRAGERGRGLGRALVLELIRQARSGAGDGVRAVIATANDPMRRTFEACGLFGTGTAPVHPKMAHCESLELQWPPDLARPVAVVTGGSRNLGRHLVERLAATHNVAFTWRQGREGAAAVAAAARAAGGWAVGLAADVTAPRNLRFLANWVAVVAGRCGVLIHNASRYSLQPLDAVDEATWRAELDSTVTAAFWAYRAFAGQLQSHPRARMILIGDSAAGQVRGIVHSPGYYVGKQGVLLLTRSIAAHWRGTGATCNCVSPGVLPNSVDLDRPGMAVNVQLAEVGGVVDFLLSPAADAVSGAHIVASRGWNV